MNKERCKTVLQGLSLSSSLILSSGGAYAEMAERALRALAKPANIDDKTLIYLEKLTNAYWQDHHNSALAPYDLFT